MKKIMIGALFLGSLNAVHGQKINLGKATDIVSKEAKALTFTNEDAMELQLNL